MNNSNLPPQLQYDFLGDSDEVDEDTGEENPNFIYNEDEPMTAGDCNIQENIVDFVEPEPIKDEEIFDMGEVVKPVEKNPEKKIVISNKSDINACGVGEDKPSPSVPLKANGKPVKLNKNGKPRKQISPEHLAKLQEARKKALETRRANKKDKVNTKELQKKKKQLLIEKEQIEVSELEEQVKTKSIKPIQKVEYINGLTKEDLYTAQLEAITKYDSVRKAEKKKKKEEKMIQSQKADMLHKIQQSGWKNTAGDYGGCY